MKWILLSIKSDHAQFKEERTYKSLRNTIANGRLRAELKYKSQVYMLPFVHVLPLDSFVICYLPLQLSTNFYEVWFSGISYNFQRFRLKKIRFLGNPDKKWSNCPHRGSLTAHDSMRPALKIGVINLAGLNCAKFRKGLSFFLYDNKKSLLHF